MARILVIEDHPDNLDLMRYLLAAAGHAVLTASDGETGLEIARRERPDLIVSDVHMPRKTGVEVVRALTSDPRFADIPVVAVTASAMMGDRETIISAGFCDYLSKPIEPETFVGQIERHLPPAA
jgi:CheY-like chemotaxis protein